MEHYAGLKARLVARARTRHRRGRRLVPRHRRAPAACQPQLGRSHLRAVARAAWLVRGRQRARGARALDRPARRLRRSCRHRLLRGRHNIQNALAASAACHEPRRVAGRGGRRAADLSRPAASPGGDRSARRRRCSSTTARPPMPTAPPPRSPRSRATSTGSSAASRRRAASPPRRPISRARQGLSDRRGQRGFRRHARGQRRLRALRDARCRRSPRRRAMRRRAAPPEPVVLLSPACASYDQYRNFEVRGDAFRALVAALPGIDCGGVGDAQSRQRRLGQAKRRPNTPSNRCPCWVIAIARPQA